MSVYEQVMVVKPEADQSQIKELVGRLTKIVTSNGGKVKNTESLGLRDLAYPIAKHNKGRYYLFRFTAPSSLISELAEISRYNNNVLRFLVMSEAKASFLSKPDHDKGAKPDKLASKENGKVTSNSVATVTEPNNER